LRGYGGGRYASAVWSSEIPSDRWFSNVGTDRHIAIFGLGKSSVKNKRKE